MKIYRLLLAQLTQAIQPSKVLIVYGPRQVGKTTLVQDLLAASDLPHGYISADELIYRKALASQNRRTLGELLGDNRLLVIDEAQRIPEIGLNLKILVDNYPQAAIIATGSASFDRARKVLEPLMGRKLTFTLWENYLMVERMKANEYAGRQVNTYFWRTYDQKELNCVEERAGRLFGYEFKWQGQVRPAARQEFMTGYPNAEVTTITRDSFTDFIE